jgi:2,3-bisphosphoglycerate-independent phosphoglycerate mutase
MQPIALVILDGFGYQKSLYGNAIANADMPFWHYLCSRYPSTLLAASGTAVGLPDGFMGNSEVGHLTLGAGRIIPSILKQFHDAIDDTSIASHPVFLKNFPLLKKSGGVLHLMGLLSDAGVHAHTKHLEALCAIAQAQGVTKIYIHAFLDGRDTPPQSAASYLETLQDFITKRCPCATIASLHGRVYAMDRDKNWDRTKISYDLLCGQTKQNTHVLWQEAIRLAYNNGITDEFVLPVLLDSDGVIKPGDGVIFYNFRPDRAMQLTEAFINPHFSHFKNTMHTGETISFFITTTRYKEEFQSYTNDILFERELVQDTLLDVIAQQKKDALVFIIAETEKYAHVTYFFRGMRDVQLPHEQRVLIPSIKAKNYIEHPEMSASQITDTVLSSFKDSPASFYLINYANADMVGHSGNFEATKKACEILDVQLKILYHNVVERMGGSMIITADHGNAEQKYDAHGKPLTAHTVNPVPFVFVHKGGEQEISSDFALMKPSYGLCHVAPTILKVMGLSIPSVMCKETIV